MSKKIIATIVVILMTLSVFSVMSATAVPKANAQADVVVFMRPGVPDPNNPGFSLTLGTLRTNPDQIVATQGAFSVLTDSVGDLEFDFTLNVAVGYVRIWVPPEFTFLKPDGTAAATTNDRIFNVWTDITNDYGYIGVSHRGSTDAIAPNWYRITIGATRHATDSGPMSTNLVIEPGVYRVRLFNLKAPSIAGLYHFKIGTDAGMLDPAYYPIIIVKGELSPAFITGVIDGDGYSGLSGKITATGTTADGRSVQGQAYFSKEDECNLLPAGICEGGKGATFYKYWLFGLAAGTYDLTATMAGHYLTTQSRFSIAAGQSYHSITFGPSKGPTVTIHVFSKHGRGTIPWNCLWQPPFGTNDPNVCDDTHPRDILVELYDSAGNKVGFWGSDYYGEWADGRTHGYILPTDPASTDYTMNLLDSRGLPSTDWEGVPSSSADFVAGFQSGVDYNVKTFVTGYVMVNDTDAFQRTFTISGDAVTVEMDLRRSNWFAITVHDFNPVGDTTLALAAVPTGTSPAIGAESGLAAINVPGGTTTDTTVILEGQAVNTGSPANDYGLLPGTYDIKLWAADQSYTNSNGIYSIRSGDPFTGTIALCNSPSALSFRVRAMTIALALRSVDSEVPSHERPWLFPGAEIWVNFLGADGSVVAKIDPTDYGQKYELVQDDGSIGSLWDVDTVHPVYEHSELAIKWMGINPSPIDVMEDNAYPTTLPPGQYNFQIYTLGYVMRRVFPAYVPDGGSGDIQADLIQGGMVRLALDFKKQLETVHFNGFVRVEVYDPSGNLVGANIYGQAQPNYCSTPQAPATCTYKGNYFAYDPAHDFKLVPGAAEGSNSDPDGQRGADSSAWYGSPSATWANWPAMDPSNANRLVYDGTSTYVDVYGFYWYFGTKSSRNDGLWANGWETTDGKLLNDYGILGSRDTALFKGGGLYTIKVFGFDSSTMDSYYADPVTNVEIPWGGGSLISITMNQMAKLSGTSTWLDMYGDMSSVPWVTVTSGSTFASATSPIDASWGLGYSDPAYYMWLPAGTHDVSIAASSASQVFAPASSTVTVSDGWTGTYDQTLVPTGVAVPEFPASMLLVMLSALGASVYLLRRKRTPD